jgi:hypothetical protein
MRAIQVLTLTMVGAALQAQTSGDPSTGKPIFEGTDTCTSFHRIKGNNSYFGPDLSEAGAPGRGAPPPR